MCEQSGTTVNNGVLHKDAVRLKEL